MCSGLRSCLAVVLVLAHSAVWFGAAAVSPCSTESEEALVQFPLEFDIASGNRLYLNGERIEQVRLTTAYGDSLYLNGVPLMPSRPREVPWYEPPSDEDYLRWVGDVPFVQELIASGESPSTAGERYFEEQERVRHALWEAYIEARKEQDAPSAVASALARLREFDPLNLVDWEREPVAAGRSFRLHWRGVERSRWTTIVDDSAEPSPRMPSEAAKAARAQMLYEALTSAKPCWCFIGLGGLDLLCGTESVAEVQEELARLMETGDFTKMRHLDPNGAREVLERQRADGGLPN